MDQYYAIKSLEIILSNQCAWTNLCSNVSKGLTFNEHFGFYTRRLYCISFFIHMEKAIHASVFTYAWTRITHKYTHNQAEWFIFKQIERIKNFVTTLTNKHTCFKKCNEQTLLLDCCVRCWWASSELNPLCLANFADGVNRLLWAMVFSGLKLCKVGCWTDVERWYAALRSLGESRKLSFFPAWAKMWSPSKTVSASLAQRGLGETEDSLETTDADRSDSPETRWCGHLSFSTTDAFVCTCSTLD